MNYRLQALILGLALIVSGAFVLSDQILQTPNNTSAVRGSLIIFMGLGLVLIGSLVMFVAPQALVASEIVSRVSAPLAKNQALILDSLPVRERGIHVPRVVLGGESQVFLVLTNVSERVSALLEGDTSGLRLDWKGKRKVLEPAGLDLMKGYEGALKQDFFGLDVEQLARLLSKAIVPEFLLCSGFAMHESSSNVLEAIWTKPAVLHTCMAEPGNEHPELCYLCSSVACALAKATGRSISIEKSDFFEHGSRVVTTYRIQGD